jgi:hypothetical protein
MMTEADSDSALVPETRPWIEAETPTGQSRLAYRLGAVLLLTNAALALVLSLASGSVSASSIYIVIDSALAIGLLDLRSGARNLVLIRAFLGAVLSVLSLQLFVLPGNESASSPLFYYYSTQLAYAASLFLLLTGRSKNWRIGLTLGLYVVGVVMARPWESFVPGTSQQVASVSDFATGVLLAIAVGTLVAATIIGQRAQENQPSKKLMRLLAITSVVAMFLALTFIGPKEILEAAIITFVWPTTVVIVLVRDYKRRRTLLYWLAALAFAVGIVLFLMSMLGGGT